MNSVKASQSAVPPLTATEEPFQTMDVATISLAHGTNDSFFAIVPTIQPLLMEKLSLSLAQVGLFNLFLQGPSLLQPLIGHLADRRNLRWLIILAPTISATLITLTGRMPSFSLIALLMLVAGFSTAGFHAIAPVVTASSSGKKLGRGMGFFMVGGELGFGLGPLAAVAVITALGLAGLPWLIAVALACSLLLYLRFRHLTTVNAQHNRTSGTFGKVLLRMRSLMLPIVAYVFITSFLAANLVNFLPTFLKAEGFSIVYAASALSIVQVSGTLGVLICSWLSDRIGQRSIVITATLAIPIFSLLFLKVALAWQVPMLIGAGLLAFSANPAFLAMVQRNFSDVRSLANGVYMAAGFVIRSLVVFLVGALADRYGMRPVFAASAWLAFLALPLVFLLPKEADDSTSPSSLQQELPQRE